MIQLISTRRYSYVVSGLLFVVAVASLVAWGLKVGIDFTGGSLMELRFSGFDRPANQEVIDAVTAVNVGAPTVQPSGADGMIVRLPDLTETQHQQVLSGLRKAFSASAPATPGTELPGLQALDATGNVIPGVSITPVNDATGEVLPTVDGRVIEELRFDSIGPAIGTELRTKTFYAVLLSIIAIILFIAWSFRKVGRPVASWKYGVVAVVALVHDVVITCGIFAALGHFFGTEVNVAFVAAVLTVLGYSVNDTIVVFDRIRENLHRYHGDFENTVNLSINETLARSINTVLTTLIALLAVYFFGGASIQTFALALIIGITFGGYSSIFVASPLLVSWHNWQRRAKA